jgi:stage II sporulation protein D
MTLRDQTWAGVAVASWLVVAATALARPSPTLAPPLAHSGQTVKPRHENPANRETLEKPVVRLGLIRASGRTIVESVPLEDYVARVVAGEGQPRAADAALEALAIAARTFALANRNRHRREGFDLCDTTHCQVARPALPAARRAAEVTSGQVLLNEGAPAYVFYSAWCGGQSARPSEVWPGAEDYAFEPSVRDEACRREPGWDAELSARDLERALRSAGLRGDRLRDLRVLARSPSGRVARLRAQGFTPDEITGNDFRMAMGRMVGWQRVRSTSFDVRRTRLGYRFTGRGHGHGVGLCVIGAGYRAAAGATVDEILRFYYPGLTRGRSSAAPETARVDPPMALPLAAGSSDIRLALPAAQEGERSELLRLLREGRDDIARRTGLAAPRVIQVTVHPSLESFGRATGQPWWAAGATLGTSVDLLPVGLLRQQGQLERAVRHELAHLVLEPSLASRPMWVREGVALYFAQPDAAPFDGRRVACPTDAELLHAVSAGAQREASGRAASCVRKAIAEGKSWRELR